jgi:hypothetical protein
MRSISNLTTLCAVAACLVQNVSAYGSAFLQYPCLLQNIEVTPISEVTPVAEEAEDITEEAEDTSFYTCELHASDSQLLQGGVSGSLLSIEIKAVDVKILLDLFSLEEKKDLHGLTIFARGLSIDKEDHTLSFPADTEITFGEEEEESTRRLGVTDGVQSVLVVRVLGSTESSMPSVDVLSDKVFGTNGDPINLQERFRSCSYGKLLIEPTDESMADNGVVEITVDMEIKEDETSAEVVVNAVKMQLGDMVGGADVTIKATFRHVIMCIPKGTHLRGSDW